MSFMKNVLLNGLKLMKDVLYAEEFREMDIKSKKKIYERFNFYIKSIFQNLLKFQYYLKQIN